MASVRISAPAAAPMLASASEVDFEQLPQHTRPSRINVSSLPEEQRKRAESIASQLTEILKADDIRATIANITRTRSESAIRPKRSDCNGWAFLQVEKRQQRETMPAHRRATSLSRPQRLIVSAPALPRSPTQFYTPSPLGNAWSGEHFWMPEFNGSMHPTPIGKEFECPYSDPERRRLHDAVVEEFKTNVIDLKADMLLSGGPTRMDDVECDFIAAMTVVEAKNAMFGFDTDEDFTKDMPKWLCSKADQFCASQKASLGINPIRNRKDLRRSAMWLQFDQELKPIVKLDFVLGSLKMAREQRRVSGLDPSESICQLVFAVQIFTEKVRRLKAHGSHDDSSDDEKMEYAKFLKSIAEVFPLENIGRSDGVTDVSKSAPKPEGSESEMQVPKERRRNVSAMGYEQRRLRGKAPSTLDLEAWASQLALFDADETGNGYNGDDDGDKSGDKDMFD